MLVRPYQFDVLFLGQTGAGNIWGVDSVKSIVTILEEGDFTEEGGGFDWRGCFSVGGYHFCRGGVRFHLEEGV